MISIHEGTTKEEIEAIIFKEKKYFWKRPVNAFRIIIQLIMKLIYDKDYNNIRKYKEIKLLKKNYRLIFRS